MRRTFVVAWILFWLAVVAPAAQAGEGPVIVVETSSGTFAFETYPEEAPLSVKRVVELVKRGFYDGQRIHRAVPRFVIQWGDPQSRDLSKDVVWGQGAVAGSGAPVGVTEFSKKRTHSRGAVALAHPGVPSLADSQLFVTLASRPELDGKYVIVGHVIAGLDVPERLHRGDLIRRVYVKE